MIEDGCAKSPRQRTGSGVPDDGVLVADVAVLARVPVMDAERALALERVMVVSHGVEQAAGSDLLSGLVAVERHRDVVLLQEQPEMQTRDPGSHDGDAGHPSSSLRTDCVANPDRRRGSSRRPRKLALRPRNDVRSAAVIELRELRSVGVLVDELHFGRAAARLGVTPSTLSRRIVRARARAGVSLFERTSRRVALTDAGRQLATRLPAALRQLDAALAAAQTADDGGWEI